MNIEKTAVSFLEDKKNLEDKEFLDYYNGHFLKKIASLYIKRMSAHEARYLFSASKNIKNRNERKKILNLIYNDYIKDKKLERIYYPILKLDLCHPQYLAHMIKNGTEEDINDIKDISRICKSGFRLHSTKINLKSHLDLNDSKEIFKPNFLKNIKNNKSFIGLDNKKLFLEPIHNEFQLQKIAMLYKCCWFHSKDMFPYRGFFNLKDEKDNIIGTIRYRKSDSDESIGMAGWVNPDLTGEQHSEMNVSLLKKISLEMDKFMTEDDSSFISDNVKYQPHYNMKIQIQSLSNIKIKKRKLNFNNFG